MYYDQGPLNEPQRPSFNNVPYQMPSSGMPPVIAPTRRKRRQGSYADYYNGMTGGGGGVDNSMPVPGFQPLSYQPRQLMGGPYTGGRPVPRYDIRQAYGQQPMSLYGQQSQGRGGYGNIFLRNARAMNSGPAPQYNQPAYSQSGQTPFMPRVAY